MTCGLHARRRVDGVPELHVRKARKGSLGVKGLEDGVKGIEVGWGKEAGVMQSVDLLKLAILYGNLRRQDACAMGIQRQPLLTRQKRGICRIR